MDAPTPVTPRPVAGVEGRNRPEPPSLPSEMTTGTPASTIREATRPHASSAQPEELRGNYMSASKLNTTKKSVWRKLRGEAKEG